MFLRVEDLALSLKQFPTAPLDSNQHHSSHRRPGSNHYSLLIPPLAAANSAVSGVNQNPFVEVSTPNNIVA